MPGFFDMIGKAAQQTAAAAQQTASEGKVRLDIRNLNARLDDQARALGHLMFRQHKGETIPEEEYVKILDEMMHIEAERRAKEAELETPAVAAAPTAAPMATPAPAPVAMATAAPMPAAAPAQESAVEAHANPAAPAAHFCNNCGQSLEAGAKFCPNCGNAIAS